MKLKLIDLSRLENEVFQLASQYLKDNDSLSAPVFYIEGGHYDPRYEISDFSIDSLVHVLNIANNLITVHKANIKIIIGILVDNLGLQCTENSCEINDTSKSAEPSDTLPEEIEKILQQYFIVKRDKILISNERNCKNKTIAFLKKVMDGSHPKISVQTQNDTQSVIYHAADKQSIELAEIKNAVTWTAKCPAIMAQHYSSTAQKILKRFPDAQDITIIDFSEIEDINKVTRGVETAFDVYLPEVAVEKINIHNVFMTDFGAEQYTVQKGFYKPQNQEIL